MLISRMRPLLAMACFFRLPAPFAMEPRSRHLKRDGSPDAHPFQSRSARITGCASPRTSPDLKLSPNREAVRAASLGQITHNVRKTTIELDSPTESELKYTSGTHPTRC